MLDNISQAAIFVLGVSAIVLVARKNRWGFVFGALSQPFWFLTAYLHQQWGIFWVSVPYGASWLYGIYEWFFKNRKSSERAE